MALIDLCERCENDVQQNQRVYVEKLKQFICHDCVNKLIDYFNKEIEHLEKEVIELQRPLE